MSAKKFMKKVLGDLVFGITLILGIYSIYAPMKTFLFGEDNGIKFFDN